MYLKEHKTVLKNIIQNKKFIVSLKNLNKLNCIEPFNHIFLDKNNISGNRFLVSKIISQLKKIYIIVHFIISKGINRKDKGSF